MPGARIPIVNTWLSLQKGTELTQPKAWFYRVVHTAALNAVARSGSEREALLRSVSGQSQADIARELGVSHPALRALVFRARRSLRQAATAVVPVPLAS